MLTKSKKSGFTLIEILVVVALIAILAAVTIIAINPAKNFADTRNTTRSSDVNTILNAITQYLTDGGSLSTLGIVNLCTATPHTIGTGTGNLDLSTPLAPKYVASLPMDPQGGTAANTKYTVCITSATESRVKVAASAAENGKVIEAVR